MTRATLIVGLILIAQAASAHAQAGVYAEAATGRPFTADYEEIHIHTDANGLVHRTEMHGIVARDAEGRSIRISERAGDENHIKYGLLNDPVAHVSMKWNSQQKLVTLTHYTDTAFPLLAAGNFVKTLPTPGYCNIQNAVSNVDLGERKFDGLTARGCLLTFQRPDKSGSTVKYTVEDWTSTDLNLEVSTVTTDPETGSTIWTLKNISTVTPDKMLFQIPAGYAVTEISWTAGMR